MPSGLVTVTSTVPALPAGLVAVIEESLSMVNDAALVEPKVTLVTFVKLAPVIVTAVPPLLVPEFGEIEVTTGIGLAYVKPLAKLTVPPGKIKTTSTAPLVWAGVVALTVVLFTFVTEVAGVPPNSTEVTPLKLGPEITTLVPPAVGPLEGVTDVIAGPIRVLLCSACTITRSAYMAGVFTKESRSFAAKGLFAML